MSEILKKLKAGWAKRGELEELEEWDASELVDSSEKLSELSGLKLVRVARGVVRADGDNVYQVVFEATDESGVSELVMFEAYYDSWSGTNWSDAEILNAYPHTVTVYRSYP